MPKAKPKLSALKAKSLSKVDGLHAMGGDPPGLYLQVRGDSRLWVLRYPGPAVLVTTDDGEKLRRKKRTLSLGRFAEYELEAARGLAMEARKKIRAGIDPIAERAEAKQKTAVAKARAITFGECADRYIATFEAGWKNPKHAQQWRNTLDGYAKPVLGKLPVSSIDTGLVMQVLEPIWAKKNETASRLRGRIEAILDWAAVHKYRSGENPARWKGHLDQVLPAKGKVAPRGHHAALPYAELGDFMAALRVMEGTGARALEFAILTAARSGEVRGATWGEIDLAGGVWTIPAGRMKAGKEHRVPLSADALKLLEALPRLKGVDLVFPGRNGPLSDMSLTAVLKRMKRADLTAHGFRSTFRDWAAELTAHPNEMAEMALAHVVSDKTEAAYRRGTMFEKRRRMMDDWAAFCALPSAKGKNVTALRGAA